MKKLLYIGMLGMALLNAQGCKDFGSLNVSPNSATGPVTSALLTNSLAYFGSGRSMTVTYAFDVRFLNEGAMYAQYTSQTQYPDESQYSVTARAWQQFYAGPLEDLANIIKYNTDADKKGLSTVTSGGSNNNQLAIARILKVYYFALVTDQWGDVPYKEALSPTPTPKYDTQKDIYTDLFKELKEAMAQFDNGTTVKGDILFGGDIAQWKRFANTFRLILALRLSKRNTEMGNIPKTEFAAALADPAGIVDANSKNVIMKWPGSSFKNPWFQMYDGRSDYAISNTLADTLTAYNDPRVFKYADPLANGTIKPVPYGLTRQLLIEWSAANPLYSTVGKTITGQTSPDYVITAAQVLLSRAEAATLGWTAENAAQLYNDAIKASWEQWGAFTQAAYDAYIINPKTSWSNGEYARLLGTQKWIALYPNGWEGWAEWRRSGFPVLKPTAYAVNSSKQIPRRYAYPVNEANLNETAYKEAVARQGADTHDTRVWWDKQ